MKKKLLTLLLALVSVTAWAVDYNVWINGVQVTDDNRYNLLVIDGVSGTSAKYVAEQKRLYLKNVTINNTTASFAIRATQMDGFSIYLEGHSVITSNQNGIHFNNCKNVSITCGDVEPDHPLLDITSGNPGFDIYYYGPSSSADAVLTVDNVGLRLFGGGLSNDGDDDETLIINNSDVWTKAGGNGLHMMRLQLSGCEQVVPSPDEYEWKGLRFCTPDGNTEWQGDISILTSGYVPLDEDHFPDSGFRSLLLTESFASDGYLSRTEADFVTMLAFQNKNLTNVRGIEYFKRLTSLQLQQNPLSAEAVDHLAYNLPSVNYAQLYLYDGNFHGSFYGKMSKLHVLALRAKGWVILARPQGGSYYELYEGEDLTRGDIDGDGRLSLTDVTKLVNMLVNQQNQ